MKKKNWFVWAIVWLMIVLSAGCQSREPSAGVDNSSLSLSQADGSSAAEAGQKTISTAQPATDVDVDLTVLSSTMVYSEVYNMVSRPENYLGKTVKMKGAFSVYHEETTGNNFFACLIADATACCSQGIEFTLGKDYVYPNDYPQEGDLITVQGVFDTYEEEGQQYCTLREAVLCG
ncbi:MAG: hypothetical protein IJT66_01695 [Clostridia bacterium]|nr:hypothetical protein [Clostridia bacterium]